MAKVFNKVSRRITQPKAQGASQAMLYATGLTEADMDKPQVGISSVWYEGNSCNMHLNELAAEVKKGVVGADLVGMRFNTIGVSDGMSAGSHGSFVGSSFIGMGGPGFASGSIEGMPACCLRERLTAELSGPNSWRVHCRRPQAAEMQCTRQLFGSA